MRVYLFSKNNFYFHLNIYLNRIYRNFFFFVKKNKTENQAAFGIIFWKI
jgi:hypothetical protein